MEQPVGERKKKENTFRRSGSNSFPVLQDNCWLKLWRSWPFCMELVQLVVQLVPYWPPPWSHILLSCLYWVLLFPVVRNIILFPYCCSKCWRGGELDHEGHVISRQTEGGIFHIGGNSVFKKQIQHLLSLLLSTSSRKAFDWEFDSSSLHLTNLI